MLGAMCNGLSTQAIASTTAANKIDFILPTSAGNVFFQAGVQISPPACSVANNWAIQVTGPNAAGGKAILATLIAAQAANKSVVVVGTGVCDIAGDRETVSYVVVYSN